MKSVVPAAMVAAAAPWAGYASAGHTAVQCTRISLTRRHSAHSTAKCRRCGRGAVTLSCSCALQGAVAAGTRSADGRSHGIVGRGLCCRREAQVKDVLERLKGEGLDDSPPPGT